MRMIRHGEILEEDLFNTSVIEYPFKLVKILSSEIILIIKVLFKVFYYSVAFIRLSFNQAKIKPPKQAEVIARASIGKSFLKNTSKSPANKTLSPIKTIIGPTIHNPQRQDT